MKGIHEATFCSLRREVRLAWPRSDGQMASFPKMLDLLRMAGRGASALTAVEPFPRCISIDRALGIGL